MNEKEYGLNDIVEMKKEHNCHKSKFKLQTIIILI